MIYSICDWIFKAALVAAAVRGALALFRRRSIDAAADAIAAAAGLLLGWSLLRSLISIPFWDHNSARLVGIFAWRHGYSLYPLPGQGPLHGAMIYPPAGALIYWPATWASSPTTALLIAGLINLACYVLPVAVWISCGFDFRAARPAWRWLAFLAFVCVSLESEGLAYSALRVHVDAPALMWSTLAMGVLRSRLPARRSLAVAFAALAALTKQTFIPVWLLALPFGSGLADERPLDRRLLMYTAFSAVGAVIVLRLFAPVNNLISDLVMLQTKYPFVDRPLASLILAFSDFVRQFWPLAAVVTFGILVDASDALRRNSILMIAAFVVFPIALVHRAKVGGDVNAFAPVLYWLLAASLFGLLRAISQEETGAHFPARVAKIILVLTVAMGSLECLPVAMHFRLIQARRILPLNPQESAYRYLRQHADGYYFPFNPLAAVMAEGRLYHTASSLADFTLQGHPLGPHDLQAGLPPVFSGVAIHESNDQDREALLHALDLRAQPVRDPAMPGWLIYVTGSDRRVR